MKIPRVENGTIYIWKTPLAQLQAIVHIREGKVVHYSLSYEASLIGLERLLELDYEFVYSEDGSSGWRTVYAVSRYAWIAEKYPQLTSS